MAAIVGSILNLINQGDALFGVGHVDVTKLALTFLVPYCVATYGAVSYRLRAMRRVSKGDPTQIASDDAKGDAAE